MDLTRGHTVMNGARREKLHRSWSKDLYSNLLAEMSETFGEDNATHGGRIMVNSCARIPSPNTRHMHGINRGQASTCAPAKGSKSPSCQLDDDQDEAIKSSWWSRIEHDYETQCAHVRVMLQQGPDVGKVSVTGFCGAMQSDVLDGSARLEDSGTMSGQEQ